MIRVHTFGGLSVRDGNGKPLTGPATQPRRMAILALLARAGERGLTRERVLTQLWPDADDERGPKALAQALYALRKEFGTDDIIVGSKELRLESGLVSSDVGEFASAIARGDDARAAALYQGPFLDGFHLPATDEFSRWAERERAALAHDYMRSAESLGRATLARGDATQSVTWWRKVAAQDPLNARYTVGLMEALVASGDRAGAIKQAHVYQLLIEQELDLPPDREVTSYAERLRTITDAPPATPPPAKPTASEAPAAAIAADPAPPQPIARADHAPLRVRATWRTRPLNRMIAAAVITIIVGAAGVAGLRARFGSASGSAGGSARATNGAVIAVGQIATFGIDSASGKVGEPVADLLATSLARVSGLRVVSRGRLLELMHAAQAGERAPDTSAGGYIAAARRATATQIIDGTVFVRPDGRLRLDLRRVDLITSAISDVQTVEGSDVFALVDSGTARLVAALGFRGPAGSVADVTTHSATAYRMYEQGIRAYYRGDNRTADQFFTAALDEDSLFALATYRSALVIGVLRPESVTVRLERAKRLAARAPDRERLTILAGWAHAVSSPLLAPLADTLVTRYPTEVEGHLYTGMARVYAGDFLAGVAPLERAITMDSSGAGGIGPNCRSCDALRWLVSAYELADSLPAAERVARRWVRLKPGTTPAINTLTEVLDLQGRSAESDSVFHSATLVDAAYDDVIPFRGMHLIRTGDYDTADRLLIAETKQPGAGRQLDAYWLLTISLREQGRLAEAMEAARRIRPLAQKFVRLGSPLNSSVLEAQVQLEQGHAAIAAALFDTIAAHVGPDAQTARAYAWIITHAANARAAAGDTTLLARLSDSVRAFTASSGYGRDRRLFHHIRGLLLAVRGDDDGAIAEFRSAIYSLTNGYTRTSYELARALLRRQRPREAIAVLQPAFRGPLDNSNLYMSRTELHELLARAWEAAGAKDSAAAHYAVVARTWSSGDPPFRARADTARRRLTALTLR